MRRLNIKQFGRQDGFVAIFSVIFFALLALVITVGFIRVTITEQQQALNNDLTARALAAAEAGVEDAKRAISYYIDMPGSDPEKDVLLNAFKADGCDSIYGNNVIQNALNIRGDGQVTPGQNLYYTCLDVDLDTPDFLATASPGETTTIPLRSTADYKSVQLEWHLVSESAGSDGDGGLPDFYPNIGELPKVSEFSDMGGSNEPPAYLRVQLVGAQKNGNISRDDLYERSRTVFLTPSAGGLNEFTIDVEDPRGFNKAGKSSPIPVDCNEVASGQYACQVDITMPGGPLSPNSNDYFLEVTPLYRDTHLRAQLRDDGDTVNFRAVQPRVDSTGRAADVFRRIAVRVSMPGSSHESLRYGVQVGTNICKQFQVTDNPDDYASATSDVRGCE